MLKFYNCIGSQPSRAIKCFLLEADIEHEDIHVDMTTAEHKSDEIMKLNPAGLVPFIVLDDKVYTESTAIMRYLCHKYPEKCERFYPRRDIELCFKIDQALDFWASTLRPILIKQYRPFWNAARDGKDKVDDLDLQQYREGLE